MAVRPNTLFGSCLGPGSRIGLQYVRPVRRRRVCHVNIPWTNLRICVRREDDETTATSIEHRDWPQAVISVQPLLALLLHTTAG